MRTNTNETKQHEEIMNADSSSSVHGVKLKTLKEVSRSRKMLMNLILIIGASMSSTNGFHFSTLSSSSLKMKEQFQKMRNRNAFIDDDLLAPSNSGTVHSMMSSSQAIQFFHCRMKYRPCSCLNSMTSESQEDSNTIMTPHGEKRRLNNKKEVPSNKGRFNRHPSKERPLSLNKRMSSLISSSSSSRGGLSPIQTAKECARILKYMEEQYDASQQNDLDHAEKVQQNIARPNTFTYTMAIDAWAKSGARDAAQHAEQILNRMISLQKTNPAYQHIVPNTVTYSSVINAWAKSPHPSAPYEAEKVLRSLEHVFEETKDESLRPNIRAYNAVIDAWARRANPSKKGVAAARRAYAILEELEQRTKNNNNNNNDEHCHPDNFSYTSVINACGRAGGKEGAQRAERLVSTMESMYKENPFGKLKPNVFTYTSLINAHANSGMGERAAIVCEGILTKMTELHSRGINEDCKPNSFTYHGLLMAWTRSRCRVKAAKRAEQILDHMKTLYDAGSHDLKPVTMCYDAVLEAWSYSRGGVSAAQHAESILHYMEQMSTDHGTPTNRKKPDLGLMPSTKSINACITAWALSGAPDAGNQAERLLHYFDEINKYGGQFLNIRPDINSYNTVINAHVSCGGEDAARKAEAVLYRWIETNADNISNNNNKDSSYAEENINQSWRKNKHIVRPNARSFGPIIKCWAQSREMGAADRAEQLLKQMETLHSEGNNYYNNTNSNNQQVKPNVVIYSTVISAWAKERRPDACKRAQSIFDRMQRLASTTNDLDLRPNTIVYNALLHAWSNGDDPDAPVKAMELLNEMETLSREGQGNVKPDIRTMNTVMLCLAKEKGNTTPQEEEEDDDDDIIPAQRAEDFFHRMLDDYVAGNTSVRPDSYSFSICINAWEKSGSDLAEEKILHLVDQMEELYQKGVVADGPHSVSYNAAIKMYIQKGEAVKAGNMLKRMERAYYEGNRNVRPDTKVFAAVLSAFSRNSKSADPHHILDIFDRMNQMYEKGGPNNANVKPNTACYNAAISALTRSRERGAALQAQELFDRMKETWLESGDISTRPDTITYGSLINAWTQSRQRDASERAMMILKEMESVAETTAADEGRRGDSHPHYNPDVVPTRIAYNTVLNALAKDRTAESADRAESLLLRMEELYNIDNILYENVSPDAVSYTSVMNAWASVKGPNAAAKAEEVLHRMEQLYHADKKKYMQPDTITYNTVLKAWSINPEKESGIVPKKAEDMLHQMISLFESGKANSKPDAFTYRTMLLIHAKNESAEKAEEYLDLMERKHDEDGDHTMKPGLEAYDGCRVAWLAQGNEEKAKRIAKRMRAAKGKFY